MGSFAMVRSLFFSIVIFSFFIAPGVAQSAGNSRGIASVDIKYSSVDRIIQAATNVYTDVGFEIVGQGPGYIIFERVGSRKKDIAYGGIQGGVIEQVDFRFQEKSPTLIWVNTDVYMIKGRGGDPFFEEKSPVLRAFAREYKKLLNKVKVAAEAQ